jgi:quinolinate synthase
MAEADFAGSTADMISYVEKKHPKRVVLVTECSMSDNVAAEMPATKFVRPCHLCPHMKRITLEGILHALETMTYEVTIPPEIAARARLAVQRMVDLKLPAKKKGFALDHERADIIVERPRVSRNTAGTEMKAAAGR